MNTVQIRKQIRQQRRSLSPLVQHQHQQAVIQNLLRSHLLVRHKRFAIYLDNDGELATAHIIKLLHKMKKKVYLPVLYPYSKKRLWFLPFNENTVLQRNRFKIDEPACIKQPVRATSLDVIFMPLVAFDEQGNRIGMGSGFYDRTLSQCKKQGQMNKPLLVGLAHELQNSVLIDKRPWDIPLDLLITENKIRKFKVTT